MRRIRPPGVHGVGAAAEVVFPTRISRGNSRLFCVQHPGKWRDKWWDQTTKRPERRLVTLFLAERAGLSQSPAQPLEFIDFIHGAQESFCSNSLLSLGPSDFESTPTTKNLLVIYRWWRRGEGHGPPRWHQCRVFTSDGRLESPTLFRSSAFSKASLPYGPRRMPNRLSRMK